MLDAINNISPIVRLAQIDVPKTRIDAKTGDKIECWQGVLQIVENPLVWLTYETSLDKRLVNYKMTFADFSCQACGYQGGNTFKGKTDLPHGWPLFVAGQLLPQNKNHPPPPLAGSKFFSSSLLPSAQLGGGA